MTRALTTEVLPIPAEAPGDGGETQTEQAVADE